jgi:hypothetical protein
MIVNFLESNLRMKKTTMIIIRTMSPMNIVPKFFIMLFEVNPEEEYLDDELVELDLPMSSSSANLNKTLTILSVGMI